MILIYENSLEETGAPLAGFGYVSKFDHFANTP